MNASVIPVGRTAAVFLVGVTCWILGPDVTKAAQGRLGEINHGTYSMEFTNTLTGERSGESTPVIYNRGVSGVTITKQNVRGVSIRQFVMLFSRDRLGLVRERDTVVLFDSRTNRPSLERIGTYDFRLNNRSFLDRTARCGEWWVAVKFTFSDGARTYGSPRRVRWDCAAPRIANVLVEGLPIADEVSDTRSEWGRYDRRLATVGRLRLGQCVYTRKLRLRVMVQEDAALRSIRYEIRTPAWSLLNRSMEPSGTVDLSGPANTSHVVNLRANPASVRMVLMVTVEDYLGRTARHSSVFTLSGYRDYYTTTLSKPSATRFRPNSPITFQGTVRSYNCRLNPATAMQVWLHRESDNKYYCLGIARVTGRRFTLTSRRSPLGWSNVKLVALTNSRVQVRLGLSNCGILDSPPIRMDRTYSRKRIFVGLAAPPGAAANVRRAPQLTPGGGRVAIARRTTEGPPKVSLLRVTPISGLNPFDVRQVQVAIGGAGRGVVPLKLVTSVPRKFGLTASVRVDAGGRHTLSAVAGTQPAALIVSNKAPNTDYDAGAGFRLVSRSAGNSVAANRSVRFVVQRLSDRVFFQITARATSVGGATTISGLSGYRCGTSARTCP